jgi:hypothetical protein
MTTHDAALELVHRSRAAQGLPERVADPVILARVAALLTEPSTDKKAAPAIVTPGAAQEARRGNDERPAAA